MPPYNTSMDKSDIFADSNSAEKLPLEAPMKNAPAISLGIII